MNFSGTSLIDRAVRITVLFLVLLAVSEEASATSAFARKFGVTCQTCHVAYPKLNAYGTAFRNLGYRLPGQDAQEAVNPDLPLGAPSYKKVWPKAVWPGGFPSQLPIALTADFLVEDGQFVEDDGRLSEVEAQFLMPSKVALIASGTAGDIISYFGEIAFNQEVEGDAVNSEVEVEHFDVRLVRPFGGSSAFNLKIGAFQPELVETFDHARRLTITNYDSMFGVDPVASTVGGGHHGGGAIALPPIARGFEAYGFVKGRLSWATGLVSGVGPGGVFDGNSAKDVYGRLGYKWGGLALDGSNADTFAGNRKNWRERSFRLNAFAYSGDAGDIFNAVADEHEEEEEEHAAASFFSARSIGQEDEHDEDLDEVSLFENDSSTRVGLDFNWFFDDLNVFGAWVSGEDDINFFSDAGPHLERVASRSGTFEYDAWFVEADLVLGYPWLIGVLRYENVDFEDSPAGDIRGDWKRATVSVTGLVRANFKCVLEHTWDLEVSKNYSTWVGFGIVF